MARVNPKMEMAQNEGKAQQIQKIEAEFNEGAPCFLFLQSTCNKHMDKRVTVANLDWLDTNLGTT